MVKLGTYQRQPPAMFNQDLFEESATQKQMLGLKRRTSDGREYVYCQATAAAIAAGIIVSKAVAVLACTVAAADAADIESQKITLTQSGTPTANQYRDGWAIITAGVGIGGMYKIRGNTADDIPASGRFTVYLYDRLEVALTTAGSTIDCIANPYDGVLINPTNSNYDGSGSSTEKPLGVTIRAVTASYYFWAQTKGLCSLLMTDGSAGAEDNERIVVCGTTAGTGGLIVDTAIPGFHKVGELVVVGADNTAAEAALIMLDI